MVHFFPKTVEIREEKYQSIYPFVDLQEAGCLTRLWVNSFIFMLLRGWGRVWANVCSLVLFGQSSPDQEILDPPLQSLLHPFIERSLVFSDPGYSWKDRFTLGGHCRIARIDLNPFDLGS